MTNQTRIVVLNDYIRQQLPRRPDIKTLDDLSMEKNTARDTVLWDKTCESGTFMNEPAILKRIAKK